MFNADFYPTPENVIAQMLSGFDARGKTILEPSAGKGNIVDYLLRDGAQVVAVEKDEDLRKILATKCPVIGEDFLQITSSQVSHVDAIIMNPPFSADEKHILHAWDIAPPGCAIIALCNYSTIENAYNNERKRLGRLSEEFGNYQHLGECFSTAERKTHVEVGCIRLYKPADNYSGEFAGFFMDEDPVETQGIGLMPYNFVRDLVNRYVAAVKLFDKQLETGVEMHNLTASFYSSELAFSCTEKSKPKTRNDFKKDLQRSGWNFIFSQMNLQKVATRGLREDINKFVEKQNEVPFTMKNIYRMLEIVIGTTEQRMDKALLEVFDKLTEHYHENRYFAEGWKTNSHYLVNRRFIFPHGARHYKGDKYVIIYNHNTAGEILTDAEKALCFITGENLDKIRGIFHLSGEHLTPGEWYDTHFFKVKAFMKGTVHCEFKSEDVWARFNQRISKLKGYPLYESKAPASKKEKETRKHQDGATAKRYKPEILFEVQL